MDDFSRRLHRALDVVGAPPSRFGRIDFLRRLYQSASGERLSTESIRRWVVGDARPQTHRIEQLARAMGISGEWLLTGLGEMHATPAAPTDEPLIPTRLSDAEEAALVIAYRALTPRDRRLAIALLEVISTTRGHSQDT